MVKPSSPTAAVAEAIAAQRGKRTGIVLGKKGDIPVTDGLEDIHQFWDAAKTPDEKVVVDKNKALTSKNVIAERPKQKPRFSLPGQVEDEGNDKMANKAKHILSNVNKTNKEQWSPSELSRVSTAPPTPASVITQHEEGETPYSPPEEVRASPDEEHEEAVFPQASDSPTVGTFATSAEPENDQFPVDDDDDDMVPPPPPEGEAPDISLPAEVAPQDDVEFPDVDDDEDDKEGEGYAIVHDPETPESVRTERIQQERERKKKSKHKKKDVASVTETSVQSKKPKRSKKTVTYSSPMGYPAGNREYEFVPVSDFKDSPQDDGRRRSRRARTKPLAFWKNERPLYEAHNETGILGEAMGNMPVVTAFIAAQPTPYKKRKMHAVASKPNKKKSAKQAGVVDVEDTPFDSRKLRKVRMYSRSTHAVNSAISNCANATTNATEI
jgi:centromere protein C